MEIKKLLPLKKAIDRISTKPESKVNFESVITRLEKKLPNTLNMDEAKELDQIKEGIKESQNKYTDMLELFIPELQPLSETERINQERASIINGKKLLDNHIHDFSKHYKKIEKHKFKSTLGREAFTILLHELIDKGVLSPKEKKKTIGELGTFFGYSEKKVRDDFSVNFNAKCHTLEAYKELQCILEPILKRINDRIDILEKSDLVQAFTGNSRFLSGVNPENPFKHEM